MQKNKVIIPPQTIGIIGGGQLGRMMAIAAKYMGYKVAVLDPTPNCPTAQVADQQITAPYDDMNGIKKLSELSDVVTYEFENVDLDAAGYIEQHGKLPQGAYPLEVTQNREKEKTIMKDANLPVPDFSIVSNGEDANKALKTMSFPAVIKTCSGGYDGKGQLKLNSIDDITAACEFADQNSTCIIEQWIPFDKEISVVFTRTKSGDITFFPIAENKHQDHILYQTTVPALISETVNGKAVDAAKVLAEKMNIVGTFALEMFVKDEDIFLNEMAPRPHNSGHYTIEACNISQFQQHIRAICGLSLMPITLLQPAGMVNILGDDMNDVLRMLPGLDNGFVHLYGKEGVKAKRKMGHITFIEKTQDDVRARLTAYEEAKK
ncbi:5-(carboxyamino)imidazole ribonucleotide synthase [Virgibacillus subterraneus]|uniref:N5-carboxyaminoimidazole ribonucleotide synthase n=2 Tax=Virgibacillus TaxID=84406 RepID=A0A1H1GEY1_9BACI|nr:MULTISPECIES: 5-(carboxyamino)imidazole ribonucleotide synthase [Virgibacillus]SDR11659.1 5-(carboxyamino)imidazole ribonucleotide synthase [Virgibacillus salinus]SEQ82570.1 5-(carboxyamino)imidazole ribonucleotide synthase [Virgibacillus subterraneus]